MHMRTLHVRHVVASLRTKSFVHAFCDFFNLASVSVDCAVVADATARDVRKIVHLPSSLLSLPSLSVSFIADGALTGLSKKMIKQLYGDEQFKKWRRGYDEQPPPISSFSAACECLV
jgi:hypothetical protein